MKIFFKYENYWPQKMIFFNFLRLSLTYRFRIISYSQTKGFVFSKHQVYTEDEVEI